MSQCHRILVAGQYAAGNFQLSVTPGAAVIANYDIWPSFPSTCLGKQNG
jgi:hypothetical protein